MTRLISSAIVMLFTTSFFPAAAAESEDAYREAVARVYALLYTTGIVRDQFVRENPAEQVAIERTFTEWQLRHDLAGIAARFEAVFPTQHEALEKTAGARRTELERSIIAQQKGRWSAQDFAALLRQPSFDASQSCRAELAAIRARHATPQTTSGLKQETVERAVFRVERGKGIRASDIEGVYLRLSWRLTGVGGSMVAQWDPCLVFKDGWFYTDPWLAPEYFNAPLSREKEPQKWGRWKRDGKVFVIEWLETRKDGERISRYSEMTRVAAVPAGARLRGHFSSMIGGGNTAYGGNTMLAATRSYAFEPDGRFASDGSAGGSSGQDYTGSAPDVATATQSATRSGRYEVCAWGLVLTFDDGEERPLLFAPLGNKGLTSFILGQTTFTGKGKISR